MAHASLSFVLAVAACTRPSTAFLQSAELQLTTATTNYAAGDSVTLSIRNAGAVEVGFFPCPIVLDQANVDHWVEWGTLAGHAADDCDLVLLPLGPGDVRHLTVVLADTLRAGTYRLRFEGLRAGAPATIPFDSRVTNAFDVK